MQLKDSTPENDGFYLRSDADAADRGPFSLENLRDLAESENLTPDFLVRPPGETGFLSFQELPELAATVFPQPKKLQFGQYEKTDDVDAGYAPVDVNSLYRCAFDDASTGAATPPPIPPPIPKAPTPPPPPPAPPGRIDTREMLEASVQTMREKAGPRQATYRAPFSAGRVFKIVRRVCAVFLMVFGIIILERGIMWQAAVAPLGLAFILIFFDLLGIAMNTIENWMANAAGAPPDYIRAEERLAACDWPGATSEFLAILKRHPKDLHAYVSGLFAASAGSDGKRTITFHSLARKNLSGQDLNLLNGALHRQGLPPVRPRE